MSISNMIEVFWGMVIGTMLQISQQEIALLIVGVVCSFLMMEYSLYTTKVWLENHANPQELPALLFIWRWGSRMTYPLYIVAMAATLVTSKEDVVVMTTFTFIVGYGPWIQLIFACLISWAAMEIKSAFESRA